MKKTVLVSLLALLCSVVAFAETRVLNIKSSFSALDVSCGIPVVYTVASGTPQVTIKGPADKVRNIAVTVKGRTLKISARPTNTMFGKQQVNIKGVTVSLKAPALASFEASSGASVKSSSVLSLPGRKVEISTSSAATVSLDRLRCGKIDIESSSSSSVRLGQASCDKIDIETSSASTANIESLSCSYVDVESTSASKANVGRLATGKGSFDTSSAASVNIKSLTADKIHADASSGSSISLAGRTSDGSFSASSGASIKASGLTVRGTARTDKSSGGSIRIGR